MGFIVTSSSGFEDVKCRHPTLPGSKKQDFQDPFQTVLESVEEKLNRWQCYFSHLFNTPRQ